MARMNAWEPIAAKDAPQDVFGDASAPFVLRRAVTADGEGGGPAPTPLVFASPHSGRDYPDDMMAAAALERLEIPLNGDLFFLTNDVELRFDRSGMAHLPAVLRKRAVRLAAEAMGGALSFEQTHAIIDGLTYSPTGSVTAEGGLVAVSWNEQHIDIKNLLPSTPYRYNITLPGDTISEEFGWQFTAYEEPYQGETPERASLVTTIDRSATRGQIYFRTLNAGDTMQPLGFDGRRKLADILSEAKLTQAARARLPIVCDMLGPIWAPGVCLDARVRPSASTERAIQIRFGTLRP
jgi:tRNA(Ile)-lysidine synthase